MAQADLPRPAAREALTIPRSAAEALRAAAGAPGVASPLGRDEAAERLLAMLDLDDSAPWRVGPAALRLAVGDRLCRRFQGLHPGGLVVSVGSFLGTRAQRVGRGAWLDVDAPTVAAMRHDLLGRRPGYRQTGAPLTEPASWMRPLGRRARPVLLLLEEPLLTLPGVALESLVDGAAAHLPPGSEVVLPVDGRWHFTVAEPAQPGSPLRFDQRWVTTWPRLRWLDPTAHEGALADDFRELRHAAFVLRSQCLPSLLHLGVG